MAEDYLDPGGILVPESGLTFRRARELVTALRGPGTSFASLVECRSASESETVILEVEVERPQIVANDIHGAERLAIVFARADEVCPEVLALRKDFPALQHQNQRFEELPRSLCLYDRPWCEIRITWTAPAFIERVRWWLKRAARDELHAEGQGLEPFLLSWDLWLVLPMPKDPAQGGESFLVTLPGGENGRVLMAFEDEAEDARLGALRRVVLRIEAPRQRHRVMPRIPRTLADLTELLRSDAFDLLLQLRECVKAWPQKQDKHLQDRVILLVDLPKTRQEGGTVESVEHCAVLINMTLMELGVALGIWSMQDGKRAHLLAPDESKNGDVVGLCLLNVCPAMTRDRAAILNGLDRANDLSILAVGAGALGSHVALNLARAGWGRWTIVDSDDLLPHNLARHASGGEMVGCRKARALAWELNWIFQNSDTASWIDANVVRPGPEAERLSESARTAGLILDMSASVAVGRHLTAIDSPARRASLFLSPSGEDLILLMEDRDRRLVLDHLEMMYYAGVATSDQLRGHLDLESGQVRYGLSCRDVSSRIGQASVASLAGIGARALRQSMTDENARIRIWRVHPDTLGVSAIAVEAEALIAQPHGDWTLQLAPSVLRSVAGWRVERLPRETGGVLMGSVNHDSRTVYLMLALPSPADSDEWPVHYIRGCEELREGVETIYNRTAQNLSYIGEWHSHPDGARTLRSGPDLKVFAWISEHTSSEGKPPVMLIAGQGARARIFVGSDKNENPPEELWLS